MDGDALKNKNMQHGADKQNVAKTQSQQVSDLFGRPLDVPEPAKPAKPAEPIKYTPTLHKDNPEQFKQLLESNPNRKKIVDEYSGWLNSKGEEGLYDYLFGDETAEDEYFENPDYDVLREIFEESGIDSQDIYDNYDALQYLFDLPSSKRKYFGDERYDELAHPKFDYDGYMADYYHDTRGY